MSRSPRTWWDTGPLETDWPSPGRHRWRVLGVVAVALVLVVAGTWAGGGFAERTGRFPLVATGTSVETAQLRVTFTRAEARPAGDANPDLRVTVYGTCENVSDTPTASSNSDAFSGAVPFADFVNTDYIAFGGPGSNTTTNLNPGLQPTVCGVTFSFPATTILSDVFLVVVCDMVWKDNTITQSGEHSWVWQNTGVKVAVPLVIVSDA
jgi:hypothetical protein